MGHMAYDVSLCARIFQYFVVVPSLLSVPVWQGKATYWMPSSNGPFFGTAANGHEHEHLAAFKPMLSFRNELPDKPGMDDSVWLCLEHEV